MNKNAIYLLTFFLHKFYVPCTAGSGCLNQCIDGYQQTLINGCITCTACAGGTFAAQGASACSVCPATTYSPAASAHCFNCPFASDSSPGSSTCHCLPFYVTQGSGSTLYCFRYPTGIPSSTPSRQPSRQPTRQPSRQPSSQPSKQPTRRPTVQPSRQPTKQPTKQPLAHPTRTPSRQPTRQPNRQPTRQPSNNPHGQPTAVPSHLPSAKPSTKPTGQPSSIPTQHPAPTPTRQPTITPTLQPSAQPSCSPSADPSVQPFARPSSQPLRQPSLQPSRQPSSIPSDKPSSQPSSMPSTEPSVQPSSQPSGQPSNRPSNQPSQMPTVKPSGQPTTEPSSKPTRVPTVLPTRVPTEYPSGRAVIIEVSTKAKAALSGAITAAVACSLCLMLTCGTYAYVFLRRLYQLFCTRKSMKSNKRVVPVSDAEKEHSNVRSVREEEDEDAVEDNDFNFYADGVDVESDSQQIGLQLKVAATVGQTFLSKILSKLRQSQVDTVGLGMAGGVSAAKKRSQAYRYTYTPSHGGAHNLQESPENFQSKMETSAMLPHYAAYLPNLMDSVRASTSDLQEPQSFLLSTGLARTVNRACFLIKPHANKQAVVRTVRRIFNSHGVQVLSQGVVSGSEIEERLLFEDHFEILCRMARTEPIDMVLSARELAEFEKSFECTWIKAMRDGCILTASEACSRLGIDRQEMSEICTSTAVSRVCGISSSSSSSSRNSIQNRYCGKTVRLSKGFYCTQFHGRLERNETAACHDDVEAKEEEERDTSARVNKPAYFYCINGFCDALREAYTQPAASVHFMALEWDAGRLSWGDLLAAVVGDRDPAVAAAAAPSSIRGVLYREWGSLGLECEPSAVDNCVHVSMSAFEGMVERLLWCGGAQVSSDIVGSRLLAVGVSMQLIQLWQKNPVLPELTNEERKQCLAILDGFTSLTCQGSFVSGLVSSTAFEEVFGASAASEVVFAVEPTAALAGRALDLLACLGMDETVDVAEWLQNIGGSLYQTQSSSPRSRKFLMVNTTPKKIVPPAALSSPSLVVSPKRNMAASRESVVLLIKPHANTTAVVAKVAELLRAGGVSIAKQETISAAEIVKRKLFARQYERVISAAYHTEPAELQLSDAEEGTFFEAFGLSWQQALLDGRVHNARGTGRLLGLNPQALQHVWNSSSVARLGRGLFVCAIIGSVQSVCAKAQIFSEDRLDQGSTPSKLCSSGGGGDGAAAAAATTRGSAVTAGENAFADPTELEAVSFPIYCINGFCDALREAYTQPAASVHFMALEWDAGRLSWGDLLAAVVGDRDPAVAAAAAPSSIRGVLYREWGSLGLECEPSAVDNCVHVSMSAFEGMVEKLLWQRHALLLLDPLGSRLLAAKVRSSELSMWMSDPVISGNRVFDLLYSLDSDRCFSVLSLLKS